jgi:hypothetical protein
MRLGHFRHAPPSRDLVPDGDLADVSRREFDAPGLRPRRPALITKRLGSADGGPSGRRDVATLLTQISIAHDSRPLRSVCPPASGGAVHGHRLKPQNVGKPTPTPPEHFDPEVGEAIADVREGPRPPSTGQRCRGHAGCRG